MGLKNFLNGLFMGLAEIIPGISGGTVALILGIYERLIHAINSFDISFINHLKKSEFSQAWKKVDGSFISTLLIGMLFSIYFLSSLILLLLETFPIAFKSFLSFLLFFSVFLDPIRPRISKEFFAGLFLSFLICLMLYLFPAGSFEEIRLSYIFLSGLIAISALVIPGISGSFILLLMGTYQSILLAVKNIDLHILCVFLLGAIIGLFSIAKLIKMAFEQKRELLMSIFFGLIIFCIPLIWMNDSNLTNEKLNIIHIILGGLVALLIVLLFNRFKQV